MSVIITFAERVRKPRTNPGSLTTVGVNSELCPDGLVVCGWHARLGQPITQQEQRTVLQRSCRSM